MNISKEQLRFFNRLVAGDNIFLTGVPCSGVWTCIDIIRRLQAQEDSKFYLPYSVEYRLLEFLKKEVIITSNNWNSCLPYVFNLPSWVSAVETWTKEMALEDVTKNMSLAPECLLRLHKASSIFLDVGTECQMFFKLDELLRVTHSTKKAFGGVQIVVYGDFFTQIETPVADSLFETVLWSKSISKVIFLKQIFSKVLADSSLLRSCRAGEVPKLNEFLPCEPSKDYIRVVGSAGSKYIKAESLPASSDGFRAIDFGCSEYLQQIEKFYHLAEFVVLKEGRSVVLCVSCNNLEAGCLGVVKSISKDTGIIIVDMNGKEVSVSRIKRSYYKKSKVVASRSQYPLVPKSCFQVTDIGNLMFEKITLDLNSFSHIFQIYEVLLRCRDWECIRVVGKLENLSLAPKTVSFYKCLGTVHEHKRKKVKHTVLPVEKSLKRFAMTGDFHGVTKIEVKAMVEKSGGKFVSVVSKNTEYLIVGEVVKSKFAKSKSPFRTKKYERALELDIKILDRASFFSMMNSE